LGSSSSALELYEKLKAVEAENSVLKIELEESNNKIRQFKKRMIEFSAEF
jgi:predicted nuclease with TOPRIM domain